MATLTTIGMRVQVDLSGMRPDLVTDAVVPATVMVIDPDRRIVTVRCDAPVGPDGQTVFTVEAERIQRR